MLLNTWSLGLQQPRSQSEKQQKHNSQYLVGRRKSRLKLCINKSFKIVLSQKSKRIWWRIPHTAMGPTHQNKQWWRHTTELVGSWLFPHTWEVPPSDDVSLCTRCLRKPSYFRVIGHSQTSQKVGWIQNTRMFEWRSPKILPTSIVTHRPSDLLLQ